MKKNWFQILSLALNVALLIALLVTRTELADTQNNLKHQLDSVAWRLMDVQDQIKSMGLSSYSMAETIQQMQERVSSNTAGSSGWRKISLQMFSTAALTSSVLEPK